MNSRAGIAQEAARILCTEVSSDYGLAKRKAAERLGLDTRAGLPSNAEVQDALLEYQRLFGGATYRAMLTELRQTAVRAMKLLAAFEPRLVGGAVTGAVTGAHRLQLHVFSEKPEALDWFFENRGIGFEADEREYRYPDGSRKTIPLLRFDAGGVGVDVAVFPPGEERRAPLSQADGLPMKRLDLVAAEQLLAEAAPTPVFVSPPRAGPRP